MVRCVWQSIRPGRIVTSPRSKTSKPAGTASPGPTAVIRSPVDQDDRVLDDAAGDDVEHGAGPDRPAGGRDRRRAAEEQSGSEKDNPPPHPGPLPRTGGEGVLKGPLSRRERDRVRGAPRPDLHAIILLRQVLLHVLLRDHRRRQNDLLRHLLAPEDLLGDVDRLAAAGRVDERRRRACRRPRPGGRRRGPAARRCRRTSSRPSRPLALAARYAPIAIGSLCA